MLTAAFEKEWLCPGDPSIQPGLNLRWWGGFGLYVDRKGRADSGRRSSHTVFFKGLEDVGRLQRQEVVTCLPDRVSLHFFWIDLKNEIAARSAESLLKKVGRAFGDKIRGFQAQFLAGVDELKGNRFGFRW